MQDPIAKASVKGLKRRQRKKRAHHSKETESTQKQLDAKVKFDPIF